MKMRTVLHFIFTAVATFIASAFISVAPAYAGTDLNVNCTAIGTCAINPAATPLYNESGWMPGSTVIQRLSITNSSSQSGFTAVQVTNYTETNGLGGVIPIDIHQGSPTGPIVYSAPSLQAFRNAGYFTLTGITPGQTIDYYFVATMSPTAGNQYQGSMVKFDLIVGLELTPIPPQNGGGSGGGGGGGGGGSANPPVCTDNAPSSAPNLTITHVGVNTVSLSWTPVSPVTHYGLFFTRNSDGAQYGAGDIGTGTTYIVTNLSGGVSYTFQVFGVNGCAPGPRSAGVSSGNVPGGVVAGRPLGNGGQVLGVTVTVSPEPTPTPTPTPTPSPEASPLGQVAGIATEACANWRQYVPWILLVLQFLLILIIDYRYRGDSGWTKHYLAIGITILSIVLFYILRQCECYGEWSWLAWLCKWYWIVAILLTLLLKGFSYAFLDETTEKEEEPKKPHKPTPPASSSKPATTTTPSAATSTSNTAAVSSASSKQATTEPAKESK